MSDPMSECFLRVGELAHLLGARSIKDLPGCWEYQFSRWHISINAHPVTTPNSEGFSVLPYHCAVAWGGWPVALFSVFDGICVGPLAEGEILAALNEEIQRIKSAC